MSALGTARAPHADSLEGWDRDSFRAALGAFRRTADYGLRHGYRTGTLGIPCEALLPAFRQALALDTDDEDGARAFFERSFRALPVKPEARERGFVTGYYEPVVEASPVRTGAYRFPLLARPDDLVDVDAANAPPGWDPSYAFGRAADGGIVPYYDRGEIDRGALDGRGLEIAWLRSRVDVFFIHVQGSARLEMPDGTQRRVGYAAKAGHPFTGIGGVLADRGAIAREDVTMQSIRAWLADNPDRVDEILWCNRSYVFFRDMEVDDPYAGPIGAAKVPLTAGRSLAVDRLLHTFGVPVHVSCPALTLDGAAFARLMVAQDTGSAIVGPARGDLFIGSGSGAGEIAGRIRYDADFHLLVPTALAERL